MQARDYAEDKAQGRALARGDVPFLFRAFEAGQVFAAHLVSRTRVADISMGIAPRLQ